jgi:hypothetical protein
VIAITSQKNAFVYDVQPLVYEVLVLSESLTTLRIRLVDHRQIDDHRLIVDVEKHANC